MNALKRELKVDDLTAVSSEDLKSGAKQVLISLCYGDVDRYIVVAPDQYESIRRVVSEALLFKNRGVWLSSKLRTLYMNVYQHAKQFCRVLHKLNVKQGSVKVARTEAWKTIDKHLQYVVSLFLL